MKRYSTQSCHSIAYSYDIIAPDTLTPEQVEHAIDLFTNWTDMPSETEFKKMLRDKYFDWDNGEIPQPPIEELQKIEMSVTPVHREYFQQSFEEEK